jgi:putative hemolysin
MNLVIIIILTLVNGLFAMSEMALASSRKPRLKVWLDAGDGGAKSALELMENPTRFLSTVQIGITGIGILNGILGDAAYSHEVSAWLEGQGLTHHASEIVATAVVVFLITFMTLIFGELVPKRIGQLYPENVARWTAPLMLGLAFIARPIVVSLSWTTFAILRLLNINTQKDLSVTQEEISASLNQGVLSGLIEKQEHEMVKNVFNLDDRPLKSMMVPRSDIVWLEAEMGVQEALLKLKRLTPHSWYPVCKGDLSQVVGVVSLGQLVHLSSLFQPLSELVVPASFVPETLSGLDLLEQFKRPDTLMHSQQSTASRIVLVVDEYGDVQGLLTPRDLLEAITGAWMNAIEHTPEGTKARLDGAVVLDGLISLNELKDRLHIQGFLPQESLGHYNTLAGLILFLKGQLAQVGDEFVCSGWVLKVESLDGRRIDRVRATPV